MWIASTMQKFCKDCPIARASSTRNTVFEQRVNARRVTSDLLPGIQSADELKYGAAHSLKRFSPFWAILAHSLFQGDSFSVIP